MTTTQSDYFPIPHWPQKQGHLERSKIALLQSEVSTPVDLASRFKVVQDWLDKGVERELHLSPISKEDLEALVSKLAKEGLNTR